MRIWSTIILAGTLGMAACGPGGEQGAGAPNGGIYANSLVPAEGRLTGPAPADADPPATAVPNAWIGRWTGPEGLFLDVARGRTPGRYVLTIKADLDSAGDPFDGQAAGDTIRITRDGEELTVRHGIGAETGFKWLADKKDCLIVVPGKEGFCRD